MWRKLRKVCQVANFWRVDSRRGGFHAGREYEKGGRSTSPPFVFYKTSVGYRFAGLSPGRDRMPGGRSLPSGRKRVAVYGSGQVAQIVARSHGHAVGSCRPDRQQIAPGGFGQLDACGERVGRLADRTDYGLGARLARGGQIFDPVAGSVQGRADQVGHTGVHDDDLGSCGGRLAV